MFENFKKLTIKGGYFDQETTLELFKDEHLSVVYGRNGSGKTTIARCMKQLVETEEEKEKRLEKIANDQETEYTVSSDAEIAEENKQQVFVFDEDFLRDQVRVQNDGLNEIVMLGEQVELDNQINAKNTELEAIMVKWNELKEWRGKYDNASDTASPHFFYENIRSALREDGGWADIDRDVKGNSVKSKITPDVVNRLAALDEPTATAEEIVAQLRADMELYFQSSDAQAIVWQPSYPECPERLEQVSDIITHPLESPELSEREKRLLGFLQSHAEHFSQDSTKEMVEGKWEFCPLCLREAKDGDIANISETLKHILNEEANLFSQMLNAVQQRCTRIEENFPTFPGDLNEKELKNAKVALANLNKNLAEMIGRLEVRKRNIYIPFPEGYTEYEMKEYEVHREQYLNALKVLEDCVTLFNKSVNERGKLRNKLFEENNLFARKKLAALMQGYDLAQKTSDQNAADLKAKTTEKEQKEAEIKALKAQKNRTDIALAYINNELQYVFYSDRKVKLVPGDGCYKLVINGRQVKPKKISVGERNVLGLCYFFAMLFSGKRDEDKYSSEYLIVIDDPVSSFDYGNRLGVMSLLRFQFNAILKSNDKSRILVMSHDLPSVFDMVKIRSDIKGGLGGEKKFFELENKKIKEQTVRNEYQKLLKHVYEYANNRGPDDMDDASEMSIGNIMRRLMEAFASFCYNTGFEKMMCNPGILDRIHPDKRPYYENFMCRLTLNGESHEEEHVYSLNTMTRYFSKDEKVQTAKSLLLFLYYINEEHMKSYFDYDKNPAIINSILSWQAEEANWLIGAAEA